METIDIIINLAPTLITATLGALAGAGGYYVIAKGKIHQLRLKLDQAAKFVDTVDNALYDDKVDEKEFVESYEAAKALVTK